MRAAGFHMLDWILDISYIIHVPVYSSYLKVLMIIFKVLPIFTMKIISKEQFSAYGPIEFAIMKLALLTGTKSFLNFSVNK